MDPFAADGTAAPRGVTVEVIVAGVVFAVSVALMTPVGNASQEPPSLALLVGWPLFALAGGVVLDQLPGTATGRVLVALALIPAPLMTWASVRADGRLESQHVFDAFGDLSGVIAMALAFGLPLALRPRARTGAVLFGGVLAALGACGVILHPGAWLAVVAGCGVVWIAVMRSARRGERMARRRTAWLLVLLVLAGVVTAAAWSFLATAVAAYVLAAVLATVALGVTRLRLAADFRPLDEPVLDLAAFVGAVLAAAVVGLLVWLGARWASLPSPDTSAWFGGLVTLSTTVPAAFWVRRGALTRRYGSGLLAPADVAAITADLHAQREPRDLLGKAARMVATASGSRDARIVLGVDAPLVPDHWVLHPLVVGGDRVGALVVEPTDPEGPELRQQQVVEQLLPTVALVARAVGLAVEAEHARRDLARERDTERARILGDLHDGLGPVLAGMSMRVQAALRSRPAGDQGALLADLAEGLAASRTDLRRLVAGLTPTALYDGDLESALERLVESFQGAVRGPDIALDVDLPYELADDVQVAVYRSVAEGITNALRHAHATRIEITIACADRNVRVDVADDGTGGPVVPGVGLTSLRQRAVGLGGCLEVLPAGRHGTRLWLELPGVAR